MANNSSFDSQAYCGDNDTKNHHRQSDLRSFPLIMDNRYTLCRYPRSRLMYACVCVYIFILVVVYAPVCLAVGYFRFVTSGDHQ